ncbi:hypothetical protein EVAR_85835_1 [Eumeta japonica]|uniref:Uncharacterized protein n=1 Tax=Eumeta variegata TaxID=151549 RepID=A0A4C1URN6_EUMVA|nr:hypothetical protein EVAR_85835_1 [Eumeta japonica]
MLMFALAPIDWNERSGLCTDIRTSVRCVVTTRPQPSLKAVGGGARRLPPHKRAVNQSCRNEMANLDEYRGV